MATDVADSTAAASAETVTTELAVTGMTCGTCAARIQRKLGRLPGVEASVNYATGRARVTHPAGAGHRRARRGRPDPRLRRDGGAAAGARRRWCPGAADRSGERGAPHRDVDHGSTRGRGRARPRALRAAPPRPRLPRADAAGDGGRDEPRLAVPVLAVVLPGAHRTRRHLGRLPLPPGRGPSPAPPLGDDGHARLGGHARRVRLVAVDALLRRRGARRHAPRPLPHPDGPTSSTARGRSIWRPRPPSPPRRCSGAGSSSADDAARSGCRRRSWRRPPPRPGWSSATASCRCRSTACSPVTASRSAPASPSRWTGAWWRDGRPSTRAP